MNKKIYSVRLIFKHSDFLILILYNRHCFIHIIRSLKVSADGTVDETESAPLRDTLLVRFLPAIRLVVL
jgi:hypothetical protein